MISITKFLQHHPFWFFFSQGNWKQLRKKRNLILYFSCLPTQNPRRDWVRTKRREKRNLSLFGKLLMGISNSASHIRDSSTRWENFSWQWISSQFQMKFSFHVQTQSCPQNSKEFFPRSFLLNNAVAERENIFGDLGGISKFFMPIACFLFGSTPRRYNSSTSWENVSQLKYQRPTGPSSWMKNRESLKNKEYRCLLLYPKKTRIIRIPGSFEVL